jgi:hypothetical protein
MEMILPQEKPHKQQILQILKEKRQNIPKRAQMGFSAQITMFLTN